MMTTSGAANVSAVAVDGTFDDCQAIVKGMFNHRSFGEQVRLSGVNSINWAAALTPDSVDVVPGGHEWPAWLRLWENFLDARF